MKRSRKSLLVVFLGVGLLVAAVSTGHAQTEDQIKFVSTVATIDLAERTLTFADADYVVIAADDCEIFRMAAGVPIPVLLSDIQIGDMVKICGVLQADNTVLAYKIRIRTCIN